MPHNVEILLSSRGSVEELEWAGRSPGNFERRCRETETANFKGLSLRIPSFSKYVHIYIVDLPTCRSQV